MAACREQLCYETCRPAVRAWGQTDRRRHHRRRKRRRRPDSCLHTLFILSFSPSFPSFVPQICFPLLLPSFSVLSSVCPSSISVTPSVFSPFASFLPHRSFVSFQFFFCFLLSVPDYLFLSVVCPFSFLLYLFFISSIISFYVSELPSFYPGCFTSCVLPSFISQTFFFLTFFLSFCVSVSLLCHLTFSSLITHTAASPLSSHPLSLHSSALPPLYFCLSSSA